MEEVALMPPSRTIRVLEGRAMIPAEYEITDDTNCHRRLRAHRMAWEIKTGYTGWGNKICTRCGKRGATQVPSIEGGW